MEKIKLYTDLGQSKRLAEVLPIESADMTHCAITEGKLKNLIIKDWRVNIGLDIAIKENLFSYRNGYMIPCWSLAALLDILPGVKIEKIKAEDGYEGYYYHIEYEDMVMLPYNKNLIDACVEMILRLHELNLL